MYEPVRVGVVGCGAISGAYFQGAAKFPGLLKIVACADMDVTRAQAKASEFSIAKACSVEDLLRDDEVEVVLNLTIPKAHVPVAMAAVEAGKHTYSEKPLGLDTDESAKLLKLAKAKGKLVGCAPDTFLGSGIQTARKLIDDGAIGKPIGFLSTWLSRGHEFWHPDPEFYYQPGGGPMLDMGPYYLTALIECLGPVKRYVGLSSITRPERVISHRDKNGRPMHKFGQTMPVTTPDHVLGLIEFENGCTGSIQTSFATRAAEYYRKHPIQIFGTEGTLRVPDPNAFDGTVALCRFGDGEDTFNDVTPTHPTGYGRSVGLADMAHAIRSGGQPRASGDLAIAVLDLMVGFSETSQSGQFAKPRTSTPRTPPLPAGLPFATF